MDKLLSPLRIGYSMIAIIILTALFMLAYNGTASLIVFCTAYLVGGIVLTFLTTLIENNGLYVRLQ